MSTHKVDRPARMRARALGAAVTLLVLAGAVGGGLGLRDALARRIGAADGPPPAPPTAVAVARIEMRPAHEVVRRFSGQFEARQETPLGFEQAGTVLEVAVREGERVEAGAVLARLDTRLLEAERSRLEASRRGMAAQVELARRIDERQAELRRSGHVPTQRTDDSSLTLARLEAGLAETEAAIAAVQVRLSKARIAAPYAGVVGRRAMDAGAVATPGATAVTLLEEGPVLFRAGLDPALARRLEPGAATEIELAGARLPARLARLSPELDAATRSRTAFFEVEGPTPPSRTTGTVALTDRVEEPGAWVPLSALRRGPRGTWTLLTVVEGDDGAVVGVEAAEIVHLARGRAFVRGTFADGALFVPAGGHRVVPGEPVAILPPGAEVASWGR